MKIQQPSWDASAVEGSKGLVGNFFVLPMSIPTEK